MAGYYDRNNTSEILDWILEDDQVGEEVRFFYADGKKLKTGVYMITEAVSDIVFESIVNYSATLLPKKIFSGSRVHYGVMAINNEGLSAGTGEYQVGAVVNLYSELENFDHWEVTYIQNPNGVATDQTTIQEYFDAIDKTNPAITFQMQASDVILKAIITEE